MRLSLLILMIFLASFGIGITGAAPPLPKQKETITEEDVKGKKEKPKEEGDMEKK
jgi:hypothetical protein